MSNLRGARETMNRNLGISSRDLLSMDAPLGVYLALSFFFGASSLVHWLVRSCFFARVLIPVGIAWPAQSPCCIAMCLSVSYFVTTELVSVRHQHGHWLCWM